MPNYYCQYIQCLYENNEGVIKVNTENEIGKNIIKE